MASAVVVSSVVAPAGSLLSESWEVEARHTGCYTGGKVSWSESAQLLGCLRGEELCLVDVDARAATRTVEQDGDGVLTFAIDPDGKNACTSHKSGLLRHWMLGPPVVLARSWKAHEQIVADLCFDASGGLVATGSADYTAKVFDFAGYFCTHNFKGHGDIVSIVRFHPSKLQLVTVAGAESRLWDLKTSSCLGVMKDHLSSISSICFGGSKRDGLQLVTGGRDQVVNIWRMESKCPLVKSIAVFENVEGVVAVPVAGLRSLAAERLAGKDPFAKWLKKDEKELPGFLIATVGGKSELRLWSPTDGKAVRTVASPHAAGGLLRQIHCIQQKGETRLVTVGDDMNMVIWSLPEFEVLSNIMGHNEEVVHVQLIPDIIPDGPEAGHTGGIGGGSGVAQVASRFVALANDEQPRVVNCDGFGALLLRGHTDVVISCDVSPDGQWIATGGKDQSIRIWCATTCRCACLLAGHAGAVACLSFPRRRPKPGKANEAPISLVSGSQDKTMKVWELPGLDKLREAVTEGSEISLKKAKVTVVAHGKEVNDVTVSPGNKYIATGGHDKLVRIWKYPSAELLGDCKGHRRGIWCVVFSPTDQVVASSSGDTTIRLWNLKDFSAIRAFEGHSSAVLRVSFLNHGMQLMSTGVDGLVKLWQIRTAECAATFEEHTGKVWCIDVLGERMVSGGTDSKLCVWRDVTKNKAQERHDAVAEAAMKDSKIGVLLREGKVDQALTLALDLSRPGQMRQILLNHAMDVVGETIENRAVGIEQPEKEDGDGSELDLHKWLLSLTQAQLEKLVDIAEQWNTNRKMAPMAQMLLGAMLRILPPARLTAVEGMNATCATVLSYSTRHMSRVDALLQKTFLFDLALQASGQGLALLDDALGGDNAKKVQASKEVDGATTALKRTMDVLLGEGGEAAEGSDSDAEAGGDVTNGSAAQHARKTPEQGGPKKRKKKAKANG